MTTIIAIIEDQAQFNENDEEEVGMLNKEGKATEDSSDEDVVGVRKKPKSGLLNVDSDTDEEGEVRESDTDENIVGVRKTVKSTYTYVDFDSDTDDDLQFEIEEANSN